MRVVVRERPQASCRITYSRTLHLEHLRAEGGHKFGAIWTGHVMSQVQNLDSGQRSPCVVVSIIR